MNADATTARPAAGTKCGGCAGCASCGGERLTRLGIRMDSWDFLVALAGNPNTGKSTIFNALTGLRQHTGNWPGKTVTRAEGGFRYGGRAYKLVDLPGAYSLLSASADEEVARDFLLFGRPEVTIVVTDATRLERNLSLALQIIEITDRVVIALNLLDEARRHGLEVDARSAARDLGVPVVPMAARRGEGVPELLKAVEEVALGTYPLRPRRLNHREPGLEQAISTLAGEIERAHPGLPNARWVALRLLDGDASIVRALEAGTLGRLADAAHANARPFIALQGVSHGT